MPVRTRKMVTVQLVTPQRSLSLDTYPGEITIGDRMPGNVEAIPILDRGEFAELVKGDSQSVDLSLDIYHDGTLSSAVAAKVDDAMNRTGIYASDTFADPGAQVWTLQVIVTVTHPGGGSDVWTASNAHPKTSYKTAKEGNTLTLGFTCYPNGSGGLAIVKS